LEVDFLEELDRDLHRQILVDTSFLLCALL